MFLLGGVSIYLVCVWLLFCKGGECSIVISCTCVCVNWFRALVYSGETLTALDGFNQFVLQVRVALVWREIQSVEAVKEWTNQKSVEKYGKLSTKEFTLKLTTYVLAGSCRSCPISR